MIKNGAYIIIFKYLYTVLWKGIEIKGELKQIKELHHPEKRCTGIE